MPVVRAIAVAYADIAVSVASFSGVEVLVTTSGGVGVASCPGRGVAVPIKVASAVAVTRRAAAVSTFCGVGERVATKYGKVSVGCGVFGGGPALTHSTGPMPRLRGP